MLTQINIIYRYQNKIILFLSYGQTETSVIKGSLVWIITLPVTDQLLPLVAILKHLKWEIFPWFVLKKSHWSTQWQWSCEWKQLQSSSMPKQVWWQESLRCFTSRDSNLIWMYKWIPYMLNFLFEFQDILFL